MFQLASILLFAVAAHGFYLDDGSSELHKDKIVGGDHVPIKEVPYQAQLLRSRRQICGAAIISKKCLITAAHCVEDTHGLVVVTGSGYRGQGRKRQIQKISVHQDYDRATMDNDIAVIVLNKKIEMDETQKVIEITKKLPNTNDKVKVSGFGKEGEHLGTSSTLKSAIAPVIDKGSCQERYGHDELTENMFCAGTGETDACQGDSGGPAVIDGVLSGVISSGEECGSKVHPGVYTQVYNYREWIASHCEDLQM